MCSGIKKTAAKITFLVAILNANSYDDFKAKLIEYTIIKWKWIYGIALKLKNIG